MTTYYNENDPFKAAWLRELMTARVITKGYIDTRSIADVTPGDLDGFDRCHFFAGVGVWDYALIHGGWNAEDEIWTGSCPCQPFSAAGQRRGTNDARHLFPVWRRLIEARRPRFVIGEQVSGKGGIGWFDTVQLWFSDRDYEVGGTGFPACGFGAPIMRQRLYWGAVDGLASAASERRVGRWAGETGGESRAIERPDGLRDAGGLERAASNGRVERRSEPSGRGVESRCSTGGLGGASGTRLEERYGERRDDGQECTSTERTGGPVNGFWSDAEWIYCRDGKYRPAKPGIFPLAHGVANRVGTLRGAGDAIVASQAIAFVEAFREVVGLA